MADKKDVLIKVNGLKTYYPAKQGVLKWTVGYVKAVDDVNLDIYKEEILGVVGEGGCGKTTLGKSIPQLVKPTEGNTQYSFETGERELIGMNKREPGEARYKMQIVFQDPYSSLNPSFIISGSMQGPLIRFGERSKKARKEKIAELLEAVNLPPEHMERYPNEFSGGQRQRIGIARAPPVPPELIVCNGAVLALDVPIQAQMLQLLEKLQMERGLIYMFTTHGLFVVEYISDWIAVVYLGRVVEIADTEELFEHTLRPYIEALLSAIPIVDVGKRRKRIPFQGDVPSPVNPPSGCTFHPRRLECMEKCRTEIPHPTIITQEGREHMVCCHRVSEQAAAKKEAQITGGSYE